MLSIVLSVINACTKAEKVPLDTLVVAIESMPPTLDPRFATDAYGVRINSLIFDSLVRLAPDLEAAPEAAERWTYANRTYTFFLRPDLRFHNGRPVEAEDIRYTFAQYLDPAGPYASMLDIVRQVRVEGTSGHLVVKVDLKYFSDKFLRAHLPVIKILPKAEIEAAGMEFSRHPIGTGGFKFKAQNTASIELEGVHAATKHLVFKVIRDDFTRYQKMLKGEVDIAQMAIPPEKVAEFRNRPKDFQVFFYPGLSMDYLLINFRDPVLRIKAVRQALTQSIARDDIIRYKLWDLAQAATSILTPINRYFNPDLKNLTYDVESAKRSLRDLNFAGHSFVLKTSNSPDAVDKGKVLAYQMSQAGLNVTMQSYEWSTYYNDLKQGNFQLATMRWVGLVDPEIYRMAFHSQEKPPGRNRGNYVNPELDKLLDEGSTEENMEQRRKIFNRVQEVALEDLAIIPLWYNQQWAIAKKSVVNYRPNSTNDFWPLLETYKIHD